MVFKLKVRLTLETNFVLDLISLGRRLRLTVPKTLAYLQC